MACALREMTSYHSTAQVTAPQLTPYVPAGGEPEILFQDAISQVTQRLQAGYCGVFELLPQMDALLLRAGAGWHDGLVGHATVESGKHSAAGETLHSGVPLIVPDIRAHRRFAASYLLQQHRIASGVLAVIPRKPRPFGILGVFASAPRPFGREEISFLETIADALGMALERTSAEDERRRLSREFCRCGDGPARGCSAASARA